jgi:Phosphoglycerol transferase and related proteins, alkaline phosphatase superfamily
MISSLFRKAGEFRFRYIVCLGLIFIVLNFALRLTLQIYFPSVLPFSAPMLSNLVKGVINDCATLAFALLFPATLILLPTNRFLLYRVGQYYSRLIIFLFSGVFLFQAVAEFFFWEEFACRFNFIAVDYLIYTTEVIQNIIEAYPLGWLMLAVALFAVAITIFVWEKLRRCLPKLERNPGDYFSYNGTVVGRLGTLAILYTVAALLFFSFAPFAGDQNRFWNEYAKNGTYELFSAFRNNELDYRAFYKTMDRREAFNLMKGEIRDANIIFEPVKGENLLRMTAPTDTEKKPNVIIVIMESMGSKLLGEHTPYLNALADEGLSFTNMMSTGTRTVRGIEAIMLSIPPTPGNSIVRRPDNERLFTLGTPFHHNGYTKDFIYGGIGFFDNMNVFFAGNGYRVTDKLDFSKQSTTFSNAWGQCDEDLYSESIRLADESFQTGKSFQQVLLTTSNHRPFTFPAGKVDMEPGSRRAAVRYADYAVGKFMRDAREKPWFDNTVFVFVGDHPSSIAGKTEVPADAYGIVCIMYGPQFFQPEKIDTLCSQIDVAPTLLASLGWEYSSPFFGTNARELPYGQGRAWISTYQLLGFRTKNRLVVLKPDASAEVTHLEPSLPEKLSGASYNEDEAVISRAVASYQCAYDLFTQKQLKEDVVASCAPLPRRDRASNHGSTLDGKAYKALPKQTQTKPEAGLIGLWVIAKSLREHH